MRPLMTHPFIRKRWAFSRCINSLRTIRDAKTPQKHRVFPFSNPKQTDYTALSHPVGALQRQC